MMTVQVIKSHDEAAEKFIMSDESSTQCMGRLIATGVIQQFADFIASEIRRDTQPADYHLAIMNLYCSTLASMFVAHLNPKTLEQAAQEFGEITTLSLVKATLAIAAKESNETNKSHPSGQARAQAAQDLEQKK